MNEPHPLTELAEQDVSGIGAPFVERVSSLLENTPGVCGGETRLAGHRVTVRSIVEVWRAGGERLASVLEHWPYLEKRQIEAALAYAADHPHEIEQAQTRHLRAIERLSS